MDIKSRMARSACFMAAQGCSPLSESSFVDSVPEPVDEIMSSEDDILDMIFAPDPQTGYPMSDLAVVYSKDSNPIIADYIQRNLMKPQHEDTRVDDADLALDCTMSRGETLRIFASRIKDALAKSVKDKPDFIQS